MVFARSIFAALLIVSLAAYALDCSPTATPEQAMQCCKSMRCMSHEHHHGEQCCKTMTAAKADIGQPSTTGTSVAPIVFEVVQVCDEPTALTDSARFIADQSHSPPVFSLGSILPLRI